MIQIIATLIAQARNIFTKAKTSQIHKILYQATTFLAEVFENGSGRYILNGWFQNFVSHLKHQNPNQ